MGWIYDTGEDWIYQHEGWAASLFAHDLPAELVERYQIETTNTGEYEASVQALPLTPYILGWRAACECGWRSDVTHLRTETTDDADAEESERRCEAEWDAHVRRLMPEHRLRDVAERAAAAQEALAVTVREARVDGASWEAIGRATGTTRQSAWERWRHLEDPERAQA